METEEKVEEQQVVEEVTQETPNAEPPAQAEAPESASSNGAEKNWVQVRQTLAEQQQRIRELQMRLEQQNAPKDELAELNDDDVVTVAQAKKLAERQARDAALKIVKEHEKASQEKEVMASYPDYKEMIETYLKPQIEENPDLLTAIYQTKNPFLTAYQMAKAQSPTPEATQVQSNPKKAEKIMKNVSRPLSAASAPGLQGQADTFAQMKPDEIWKMSQQFAKGR